MAQCPGGWRVRDLRSAVVTRSRPSRLADFLDTRPPGARSWARANSRPKRALYVSSPIGLGHVRRDLAIADELRNLHPDLEIEWPAQDPVTAVLESRGERIHPASVQLASESRHVQEESEGQDLHVFQALRRMDEILTANFMVFLDAVRHEQYDLWIADEAWDVDYFLHENPELKTAAYAWLTDFVGYLPMADGGEHERFLTADYNAEMIEQIARYPRVRDRATFVGEPGDIVPDSFGPGCRRSAIGPRGTSASPATSPALTWWRSRIGPRSGGSSDMGPMSRFAS
jgi:hypothetical protein